MGHEERSLQKATPIKRNACLVGSQNSVMDKLTSDDDYDDLPEDGERYFVEFENRIYTKMATILDDDQRSEAYYKSIKSQYMVTVYSVAQECGVTSLPSPPVFSDDEEFYTSYSNFELAVQGEVARIRVRGRRRLAQIACAPACANKRAPQINN